MFFALIRSVLFKKRLHVISVNNNFVLSRNLSQNTSFLSIFGYDRRSVLKHVLKSNDLFLDVYNSRKRVVGLIYTKQFMS